MKQHEERLVIDTEVNHCDLIIIFHVCTDARELKVQW